MAYTLNDLAFKVQKRIRDTQYDFGEIKDAINEAQYDAFNEYVLPFMEATQSYTTTASVSDITNGDGLPANYNVAIDLTDTSNGREQVIPFRRVTTLEEQYPDADDQPATYPQFWYYYAQTIRLYPRPAGAYTLRLRYYKKPTELTADDQVPEIPEEFGELLIRGAAYRILQVKDQYDFAAIHQNKYDELLQKMAVRYSNPQLGTPVVMPVNRITTVGNF